MNFNALDSKISLQCFGLVCFLVSDRENVHEYNQFNFHSREETKKGFMVYNADYNSSFQRKLQNSVLLSLILSTGFIIL